MSRDESQAFLDTVLAHPDDDGPRLVMADYLEERGECDRAEFIRVQVELAKIHNNSPKKNSPRNIALRCRVDELLTRHGGAWTKELFPTLVRCYFPNSSPAMTGGQWEDGRTAQLWWSRGFVDTVCLSWADWGGEVCGPCSVGGPVWKSCTNCHGTGRTPGHAAELLKAAPIRSVRLTTMPELETFRDDAEGFEYQRLAGGSKHDFAKMPRTKAIADLLAAEWSGVAFTLPAVDTARTVPDDGSGTLVTRMARPRATVDREQRSVQLHMPDGGSYTFANCSPEVLAALERSPSVRAWTMRTSVNGPLAAEVNLESGERVIIQSGGVAVTI